MGIVLWRGYFQSVRPVAGHMLVSINTSTGTLYKPGNVLDIRRIITEDASKNVMLNQEGQASRSITLVVRIAFLPPQYSRSIRTYLSTELLPGEVPSHSNPAKGRTRRDQQSGLHTARVPRNSAGPGPHSFLSIPYPSPMARDLVEFATIKNPDQYLRSIFDGHMMLNFPQSQYMHDFGMHIDENPVTVNTRVLVPPTLRYGPSSKQPIFVSSLPHPFDAVLIVHKALSERRL